MPKTRVEYATDQITVYRSCPFTCNYCYVWNSRIYSYRVRAGKYDPVEEARRYRRARRPRIIVVSFVSDPYPPAEERMRLTRRVLEELAGTRHRVMVLTKNPGLAVRLDLDLMAGAGNVWLGSTVVSLSKITYEPHAPPPRERLNAIRHAYVSGVPTWLSIEPIIPGVTDPSRIISETHEYVEFYVLGSLNHGALGMGEKTKRMWYAKHVPEAVELLRRLNKAFVVKGELRRYLGWT